jgi:hypothetical protein
MIHIFKSSWSILSTIGSSATDIFLISLSAQNSYLSRLGFRMIPYSIRWSKGRAQFYHSTTVLHLWTVSIILYDIFPCIPNKSLRKHLSLNSNLNCKIVDSNVVRTSRNYAMPSTSIISIFYWIVNWLLNLTLIIDGWLRWVYLNVNQR